MSCCGNRHTFAPPHVSPQVTLALMIILWTCFASPSSPFATTQLLNILNHVSCLHLENASHVEVHPTPRRTLSTRKSDTLTTSWHHRADSYAVLLRLMDPIMTGIQHKRPALSNISDSIAGFFLDTLFESPGRRACHGPPPLGQARVSMG